MYWAGSDGTMTDCDFMLINPLFVSLHGFVGSFKKRPVRPAP